MNTLLIASSELMREFKIGNIMNEILKNRALSCSKGSLQSLVARADYILFVKANKASIFEGLKWYILQRKAQKIFSLIDVKFCGNKQILLHVSLLQPLYKAQ